MHDDFPALVELIGPRFGQMLRRLACVDRACFNLESNLVPDCLSVQQSKRAVRKSGYAPY
jgi:hypothetical protein